MRSLLIFFLLAPCLLQAQLDSTMHLDGIDSLQWAHTRAIDYSEIHPQLQPNRPDVIRLKMDLNRGYSEDNTRWKEDWVNWEPVVAVQGGFTGGTSSLALGEAQLGARVRMQPHDRWTFGGTWAWNGGFLPDYLNNLADSLEIIPGFGKATSDGDFRQTQFAEAFAGFRINKYFYLEAGQGRHFWGDGYRSLILSHNAAPYPYLRLETKIWRVKYINLWTFMRDFAQPGDSVTTRGKFMAAHALSWNISSRVNIGLYEMVTWQGSDLLSDRGMELNYLNPIVFYRPVEFAQGSADNVLMALTVRWRMQRDKVLYGQILIDEFLLQEVRDRSGWWANKFGGQVGLKWFNARPNLHLQTEINVARPYTYTHGSVLQNYGQMHQSLAHPMGTNFLEWVNLARYQKGKWDARLEYIWAIYGRDRDEANMGGDIYRSYRQPFRTHGNYLAQGLKSTFHYIGFNLGYEVIPEYNGALTLSYAMRYENNEFARTQEHMLWLGIRANPVRTYRDF